MRIDTILSEDFDLQPEGEEWADGESDAQNGMLLSLFAKGENKEFPYAGFGAELRLKSPADKNKFLRDLKVELENDGYTDVEITLNDDLSKFEITI